MTDEEPPYLRVYAWKEGRVLSAADVSDLTKILDDYKAMIENQVDLYRQAREQVLREIGGEELVKAAASADEAISSAAVTRALKVYYDKVEAVAARKRSQN